MANTINAVRIKRPRHTRQQHYRLECKECDAIIAIHWERIYSGIFQPPPEAAYLKHTQSCPLCRSTQLITYPINTEEYNKLSHTWDLVELGEGDYQNTEENIIDLTSLSTDEHISNNEAAND